MKVFSLIHLNPQRRLIVQYVSNSAKQALKIIKKVQCEQASNTNRQTIVLYDSIIPNLGQTECFPKELVQLSCFLTNV